MSETLIPPVPGGIIPPSSPRVAKKTTIFKVVTTENGKPIYKYFSPSAVAHAANELFSAATETPQQVQIASFQADASAINLEEFLLAGGMLVGPVQIK